jgi:tetratricopeptide (TPR) repeat protein
MRHSILAFLLLFSVSAFSQPSPQEGYPDRIKLITEQLKTDSLNYQLIWERLDMQVNLMGSFPHSSELYSFNADSHKSRKKDPYFEELQKDFTIIYDSVIQLKEFDFVDEGDFYLNRVWFYFNKLEFEKAIEDAKFLRDSATSKFFRRGEYYNDWALFSLFNLYVVTDRYEEALTAVNTMLEKKRIKDPKIYYCGHGSFLTYRDKVELFENFNREDQIIPFLKQLCRENFDWYIKKAEDKDKDPEHWELTEYEYYTSKSSYSYFMGCAKESSFQLLELTIDYMRKFQHHELAKFEWAYNYIRHQMNENHETINPGIGDYELKHIMAYVFE